MPAVPILSALRTPERQGRSAQAHAWCEWCEAVHSHSASPGHRVAHCHRKESPYLATGYDLVIVGDALTPDAAVPAALLAGHARLRSVIEDATPGLRSAFVRHVLGRRRRVGRARVTVFGAGWSIDTGAAIGNPGSRWVSGSGLLGLLSAIYGVGRGVAGVRLLEAISGEAFDAQARTTIAGAIDASADRATSSFGRRA